MSAAGLAWLAAVAGEAPPAREKVEFSGTGSATALPSNRPKAELPSKSFEFLDHGNSISGVVAPPMAPAAAPNYQRNTRLLELYEQRLDQKRNWIFGQPADLGRTPTPEELFNSVSIGDAEKRPKTALELFLAGSGPKPGRGRAERAGSEGDSRTIDKPDSRIEQDERVGDEVSSPLANPNDSSRILSAGFSISFPNDFLSKSASPLRLNEFANTPPADPVAKAREDRKHTEEFKKLLNFAGSASPLTTGLDPIHLGLDTTRPELSLMPAPRLGELPGTGGNDLNPLRSINGPAGATVKGLEDRTTRILGPSSLAPAVSTPSGRPVRQPSPTGTEFPKRDF
jgi:hypothetical protein